MSATNYKQLWTELTQVIILSKSSLMFSETLP